MPQGKKTTGAAAETLANDPVLNLRRDDTLFTMLAEGFHRAAAALRAGSRIERNVIAESVDLHRLFIVDLHHRKEQFLAAAVKEGPSHVQEPALAQCRRSYDGARRSAVRLQRDFDRWVAGTPGAGRRLAGDMDQEADRWLRHLRHEEALLYPQLSKELPARASRLLADQLSQVRADAAALEERVSSWTSRWGPSSD
ncbi:MAG: hypothetical protein ACYDFT_02260 [Thermoplasmata archaeon]